MNTAIEELEAKGKAAKAASRRLAYLSTDVKNKALANIADDLLAKKDKILAANEAIGVLITLEPPTGPMKVETVEAGYYHSQIWDKDYIKIQILTIEELLQGKTLGMPPQTQTSVTFARAPKVSKKEGEQLPMG